MVPSADVYVNFDDFHEGNHQLARLDALRRALPGFKATLFTIPGLCSARWLWWVHKTRGEWLAMVPHGWLHPSPREAQDWDKPRFEELLFKVRGLPLDRGWKSPGWQISQATFEVCAERDIWVADQEYNRHRRPHGLRVYELGPSSVHGHIGHMGGHNANEIELIYDQILKLKGKTFGFCRHAVIKWQPTT